MTERSTAEPLSRASFDDSLEAETKVDGREARPVRSRRAGHLWCLPKPGDVVGGAYRLVRAIGRGGMGIVYEAQRVETRGRVAIKLMHPGAIAGVASLARFVGEAKAAGASDHPSIIDIGEVGITDGGQPFLVMELLDGCSLAQRLERSSELSLRRWCSTAA